jgi:putative 4-mercaptohistidine N1-methyltranferase
VALLAAGPEAAGQYGRNYALAYGSSSPVDALTPNLQGFHDIFGNVWQWTEDHLAALPGFKVHKFYDDFSTPCFDGLHHIILGGSFLSMGDEVSTYSRFHFRAHFSQHAGFRLVQPNPTEQKPLTSCTDAPPPHVGSGPCCSQSAAKSEGYDSVSMLGRYLNLHFPGTEGEWKAHPEAARLVGFAQRCANKLIAKARELGLPLDRALDVGCAVGGSSFDLARDFHEVLAFDLSAPFIEAARRLQSEGSLAYSIADEGDLQSHLTAVVADDIDRGRITFRQADACSLPADLGLFQAVLAANLIDRLPSPSSFLGRMGGPRGLVAPGGLVLITSPYTWRENYTPREAWLGGFGDQRTLDGIGTALGADFKLLEVDEMPLVIREHARKFELIFAQASLWQRK